MGGSIAVESEMDKGSAFRFTINVGVNQDEGRQAREPVSPPAQPFQKHPTRPRAAMRILVAEDNPVNQKLAVRLLEKLGHHVHLVENGEAAVEAVKSQLFDAVLMDLQMPVMGGLAAVAAIREWEKDRGIHVPVIAMTAHAMQGDRERCLEGGMDGYVSKPIDINALVAALQSIVPSANDAAPPLAPVPEQPATKPGVNLQILLERLDNDRALLCDLIGVFMAECPKCIADMEEAVLAKSGEKIHRSAHKFKGSVGSLAAEHAAALALALESAGRSGDVAEAERVFAQLKEETDRLLPQLTEISEAFAPKAANA